MKYVVLLNPLAGCGDRGSVRRKLAELLPADELTFEDATEIADLQGYLDGLGESTRIILAGGDGTLNRFVNTVDCDNLKRPVYLYAAGCGNDFYNDLCENIADYYSDAEVDGKSLSRTSTLFNRNHLIKNLPSVTVNGIDYKFVNGVGYGIDGYCCEVGDKLKAAGKKVNYTSIAIKGLLFHFKPRNAVVTVDGVTAEYKGVWIAPTMNGRFYGGGMIPTPAQNRSGDKLSLCLMYGKGRLSTLMAFPSIFKGEHVKKENMVKILEGREITVKFDEPCAIQIDGETILDVKEYTARR